MSKPLSIKDARGAKVELWGGGGPQGVMDALSPAERKQITKLIWPTKGLMSKLSASDLLYYLSTMAVFCLAMVIFPSSVPRWVLAIMMGGCMGVVTKVYLRHRARSMQSNAKYIDLIRSFDRCPACLYQLTGQPVESDGCIVCSECGSAWRGKSRV